MLKQKKVYTAIGGFGDLFRVLPLVSQMGLIDFILCDHFDQAGIPEILKRTIPEANVVFDPQFHKYFNLVNNHHVTRNINRSNCPGRIGLSDRAISLFEPDLSAKDKLIIHPVSCGIDRRYLRWSEVDLSGFDYQIVGYPGENGGIEGNVYEGDFMAVCRLLRGSKGLLCVDSCVMHLANLLNVPSVALYHHPVNQNFVPNYGPGLICPYPEQVSAHAKALFSGKYQDFWIKRDCQQIIRDKICSKS